jgi:hypothetical protein
MRFPPERKPFKDQSLDELRKERQWWKEELIRDDCEDRWKVEQYLSACERVIAHRVENDMR